RGISDPLVANDSDCGRMSEAVRHPFNLAGRVVLVTGAVRGLGFEMAHALAQAGAHAVINGRDPDRAEAAAARVRAAGGAASAAAFDVSDVEPAAERIAALAAQHGRLDAFINNVGARNRKGLLELTLSEIREQIETNLVDAMWL